MTTTTGKKSANPRPDETSLSGALARTAHPTSDRPKVSVIIPTLNEAENLPLVLPYMPLSWIDEVLVVDGHSTDGTVEVARQLLPSVRIIMEERRGKGAAMNAGYQAAIGDILIVMDADGSNDPREIPRFIKALLEGADLVKGSRFTPGGGTTDMPRYRMLGNGGFVLLSNLLFNVQFTDLCYGYHAFWRYCLDTLRINQMPGFEIDTAIYLQAANARLRVVEVPSFEGYRFFGVGKLQTIPDGFRVLNTILKQWLTGRRVAEADLPLGFRGIKYAPPQVFGQGQPMNAGLQERLLEFVQLLGIMMLSGNNPTRVMERVLRMVLGTVDAASGSLILIDENGEVSQGCLASENGFKTPDKAAWADVLDEGVAGWAIKNRQPVLILDTQKDPRWLQRTWDTNRRSAIALPLSIGGMVIGALTLVSPESDHFTQADVEKLTKLTMNQ